MVHLFQQKELSKQGVGPSHQYSSIWTCETSCWLQGVFESEGSSPNRPLRFPPQFFWFFCMHGLQPHHQTSWTHFKVALWEHQIAFTTTSCLCLHHQKKILILDPHLRWSLPDKRLGLWGQIDSALERDLLTRTNGSQQPLRFLCLTLGLLPLRAHQGFFRTNKWTGKKLSRVSPAHWRNVCLFPFDSLFCKQN